MDLRKKRLKQSRQSNCKHCQALVQCHRLPEKSRLAGSDTTAGALRITLPYVITSPRVYNTLLAELSTSPLSNPVKDSEARKLPYLQAVIREGLRMCPPAAGHAYRLVPDDGDTLCGYHVPAGTKVGYNLQGMMEDPKIWGEDAKLFRPERWLKGTPEDIRKMEATVDLAFGYGKWACLGKTIAQMTLNKTMAQVRDAFKTLKTRFHT